MGLHNISSVMKAAFISIVLLYLASPASSSICNPGYQYLNVDLQKCVNCTVCTDNQVVIRPCEIHRDTVCGQFSDLCRSLECNPHRHKHNNKHHRHKHPHSEEKQKKSKEEIVWKYGDDVKGGAKEVPEVAQLEVTSTEVAFSSAETLVWDWQAIALTSAVFSCILFFLVIALYSLHQAKQWRRLKENFEADVEELSASLMAAASSASSPEKGKGPITDGNYLNRCVYLEQLLNVRKEKKNSSRVGGNVYIEES